MRHQDFSSRASMPSPGGGSTRAARAVDFIAERYLLLPAGALIALVWANVLPESYFRFSLSSAFVVNEILMAFFLALIAQEILEAVMPGGALHTWRRWIVPVGAAAGGAAGAATVYLAYVGWKYQAVLAPAWPAACAIDLVAGYYLLKAIFRRNSAIPFLLVLAIVTNGAALMVLSLRYDYVAVRPGAVGLLIAAGAVAAVFRWMRVRVFWPYFAVPGTLSWLAFYFGALHPALALVPIVPFLPHERRRLDLLEDNPPDTPDAVRRGEHRWTYAVQLIVFLFGLVNAGVLLKGHGAGTWAMVAASLFGRPLGILLAVALITAVVGRRSPLHLHWRELVVAALATSSGFTTALLLAVGLVPIGPILAELKLGALFSVAGAALTLAAARLLHVGRFSPAHRAPHVRHATAARHAHA